MILVVAALPQELGDSFNDVPNVIFTGVGKVNAAHAVTKALVNRSHVDDRFGVRPFRMVVNFGTAGFIGLPTGTLVHARQFHQYDMDCTPLGVEEGVTPFETVQNPIEAQYRLRALIYPLVKESWACHTADKFCEKENVCTHALHDMEAYAIAKVCYYEQVSFVCVKYISDSGNADEWKANCHKAAPEFRKIYDRLMRGDDRPDAA